MWKIVENMTSEEWGCCTFYIFIASSVEKVKWLEREVGPNGDVNENLSGGGWDQKEILETNIYLHMQIWSSMKLNCNHNNLGSFHCPSMQLVYSDFGRSGCSNNNFHQTTDEIKVLK